MDKYTLDKVDEKLQLYETVKEQRKEEINERVGKILACYKGRQMGG